MTRPPTEPEDQVLPYAQPAGLSLAGQAARGFVWLLALTVANKLINTVCQIILAWLLAPDVFGVVAKAYTVSTLANILLQSGQREVLIHRHRRFDRLSNPAFWMSLTSGMASGAVTLALAPVAAAAYHAPEIVGLLAVLALWAPLYGAATVPTARVQAEMRFRLLTQVGAVYAVVFWGLTVGLAAAGWGAYSFVLPWPVAATVRLVIMWSAAPCPVRLTPDLRRWRLMLSDSLLLLGGRAFAALIGQGDYILLGLIVGTDKVVGVYYFGFNPSMQTLTLLGVSLDGILLPALSKVAEPDRQRQAFLAAVRLLAAVGVPLSLLQAAVAEPLIKVMFAEKWYPAIPVMQVLSVAMAFRLVGWPSTSLIQAQGRFRTYMTVNAVGAAVFLAVVGAAAAAREGMVAATAVAVAAAGYFTVEGPVVLYTAIRPAGGRWLDVLNVYGRPVLFSAISLGLALWAARAGQALTGRAPLPELILIVLVAVSAYLALMRSLMSDVWMELKTRVRGLLHRG